MKLFTEKPFYFKKIERKKKLLLWNIILTICTTLLLIQYIKTDNKIKFYKKNVSQLIEKQKTFNNTKKINEQLKNSIAITKEKIFKSKTKLNINTKINKKNYNDQMINIARYARKNQLYLNEYSTEKTKEKNFFIKQNINYNITGKQSQIRLFINEIKKNKTIKCKKLNFDKKIENNIHLKCVLQFINFKNNL